MPEDYSAVNERRHSFRLRTMTGVRGADVNKLVRTSSQPVYELETDPHARPELLYPGGERQEGAFQVVSAGGAGFVSRVAIFNPVNSNVIGVLEWAQTRTVLVSDSWSAVGIVSVIEQPNYAPFTGGPRDSRQPNAGFIVQGPLQPAFRNNAALTANERITYAWAAANTPGMPPGGRVTITPGFGAFLCGMDIASAAGQANQAVLFGLVWRWRPASVDETGL